MESHMRPLPFSLALLALVGCPTTDKAADSTDTAGADDTGTDVDLGPPGCINLNGEKGDFDSISAAMEYAVDGDTINVCAGTYADSVTVDKAVSIVGESSETTQLDAESNKPGFAISAGATISGFTITSTRSGVTVSGATGVTLSDLAFDGVANYGVEASEAEGLLVSGCTFTENQYGGVFLSGGSGTVEGSLFTEPVSYGIWATGGATLTATANIFDQVHATTNDGTDGHAIFGDESTVAMSGNTVSMNDLIGVWMQGATLTMQGDLIADTPYAVLAFESELSVDGVEIYGAVSQGIYAAHPTATLSVSNTTVALNGGTSTDLVSCSESYEDWGGFCGGVLLASPVVNVTNLTESGYENYGLIIGSYDGDTVTELTVTGSTLDDNGRYGLRLVTATGTVSESTVSNTSEPDESLYEPCTYLVDGQYYTLVDRGASVMVSNSQISMVNVNVSGGAGWGISILESTLDVNGGVNEANQCAGVINFRSVLSTTGATYTHAERNAAVYDYEGSSVITGNSFIENAYAYEYQYDDGAGGYYIYSYTGYGQDIYLYNSGSVIISDNTFVGGDGSIQAYEAGAEITNNTWEGYNGGLVEVYYGSESNPVVLSGGSASNVGGTVLSSYYGYARVEDFYVESTRPYSYHYESYHVDSSGVATLQYEGDSEYGEPVFEGYGYYSGYWSDTDGDGVTDTFTEYGEESSISIENVSVGSSYTTVVDVTDSALELAGLTVESAGGAAIDAYWDHYAPQLEVEDVYVGTAASTAIVIDANSSDAGYALLNDIELGVIAGSGVRLTGMSEWTLEGLSVLDTTGYGLRSDGSYSYYDYNTSTTVEGVVSVLASASEVSILSASNDGISITDGSFTLTDSVVEGGESNGMDLTSVSAEITGNSIANNAGYGLECEEVTLTSCTGNTFTNNTSGDTLNCGEDACTP